jgi:hypothetical protein
MADWLKRNRRDLLWTLVFVGLFGGLTLAEHIRYPNTKLVCQRVPVEVPHD